MPNEELQTFRYRVLRYSPYPERDEWVNVGVMLEDLASGKVRSRIIEDEAERARVRRLHPKADMDWLRGLQRDWDSQFFERGVASEQVMDMLERRSENLLQFGPTHGLLAQDFSAELDRLYHVYVALPPQHRVGAALIANTRAWVRARISDVFRKAGILNRMEKSVKVEEFTQRGDPQRIDYSYRRNGTRGYVHAVSLARDPAQVKALAYTFDCIRGLQPKSEFTAIAEREIETENPRDQFIARLFADSGMKILAAAQLENFAEELRPRLN